MENFRKFADRIVSVTPWWIALIAAVIFILFSATVLPDQSNKAALYSADVGSPDLSLFYSKEDLYQMAEQYGSDGRQAYVRARFTFDLAFPIIYGAFLLFSSTWPLKRLTRSNSPWRLLVYIPLLAVIFDFFENASAAIVIGRYPSPSDLLAFLTPFFTLIKWIFVASGFVLPIIYLVILILRRLRK